MGTKKRGLTILQLILIVVVIFSLSRIETYYYSRYKSQEEFKKTEEIFPSGYKRNRTRM